MPENEKEQNVPSVWDDSVAPGGWVCSACGMPTESEPCGEHQSMPDQWDDRPAFALDADVTVYWPEVRPCWEAEK